MDSLLTSATAPVREGDLLAGKYRVERILGAGGMGIVVAARHEQLEQLVAIKFVRAEALDNVEAIERFVREARAAARLRSDHAAKVIDVGRLESGAPYMVMEFLEGQDLANLLSEQGAMSLEAAVQLILQACEAIAEAHAVGIVHRDLKPQNLFLTQTIGGTPKLKVLDFGVSKAMGLTSGREGGLTRTSTMLGSPLYMAPEQMRSSRDVDARADIWGLGVVLYELLTRRWPFEAETMPELCLKVVGDPPQPIAAFRPDLPEAAVAVIEKCLEKDPAKRFASAVELAQALEPFAGFEARPLFGASAASRALLASASGARAVAQSAPTMQAPGLRSAAPPREAPSSPSIAAGSGAGVPNRSTPTLQSASATLEPSTSAGTNVAPTTNVTGWGSLPISSPSPLPVRKAALWAAAALAVATVAFVFSTIGHHAAKSAAASASTPGASLGAPPREGPTATAALEPIAPPVAAAPTASSSVALAPVTSAPVVLAPVSQVPSLSRAAEPGTSPPRSRVRAASPHPTPAGRASSKAPESSDDDIPALR